MKPFDREGVAAGTDLTVYGHAITYDRGHAYQAAFHWSGEFEPCYWLDSDVGRRWQRQRDVQRIRSTPKVAHAVLDLPVYGPEDLEVVWRLCSPPDDAVLIVGCYYGVVFMALSGRAFPTDTISPEVLALAQHCLVAAGVSHVYAVAMSWGEDALAATEHYLSNGLLSDVVSIDGRSGALEAGLIKGVGYFPLDAQARLRPAGYLAELENGRTVSE